MNGRRGPRCCALVISALLSCAGFSDAADKPVWLIEIDGAIGPATADYFVSNLKKAEKAGAELFVLQLDTPGGLDLSMRDMIKAILASTVPVATFVAPNGSRAASAGTYLMYASHVAAMAPTTNIGSSTPVSIGGEGSPFPSPTAPKPEQASGGDDGSKSGDVPNEPDKGAPPPATTMERKVTNDAVAYIRGLAQLRGRNIDWAEKTVRDAVNLPASDALAANVIDLIATDLDDLFAKLDGRKVTVNGQERTLDLKDPVVTRVVPGWRYELLSLITDPNVAYILLMIGIYGLILEFYNPGTTIPGVTGVICLLLAAYALQTLPVNYAGLGLLFVGIALMIAEHFVPGFGVLGIGGVIAFVIGSVILMDTDLPAYQISMPIIAAFAVASAALFLFVVGAAVRSRRRSVVSGREAMIGASAEVQEAFSGRGLVRAFGELWQAESRVPVGKGSQVRIVAIKGLVLTVERGVMGMEIFTLIIFVIVIAFAFSAIRTLREYERGVIFLFGRFTKVKGPGLIFLFPIVQQMVRVDLRTLVLDVPTQDLITRDNVSVKVNAVLYFRVVDPQRAIINVEDYMEATGQLAQTTLRSVLGQHELDELLAERDKLNVDLQKILDQQTDQWGIKVSMVEIKHVDINESMIRAIAKQAEAERERRAKVIHADGEFQASQKLVEAAAILATQPQAIQLRYLQTLTEIAGEKSSTIVFPLPINLMETLQALARSKTE